MKLKLSVFLACVLLAQVSMAQFTLGVKGGANIMKIQGKSFKDEFNYGYNLGGFAILPLGGRLAIQPEVLLNQYQTKTDSTFSHIYQNAVGSFSSGSVKLNYLSIPLLLDYKLGSLLSLQAGPMFSILMDKNKNLLQNGESAFKNGDFAMVGGAQLSILKLKLSGRYVVGLNNINDIDNQDKWKSQGWQLSVGFGL